jgi:hypothetical protein
LLSRDRTDQVSVVSSVDEQVALRMGNQHRPIDPLASSDELRGVPGRVLRGGWVLGQRSAVAPAPYSSSQTFPSG